jgi:HAD superfamily hydrolase (TIGR01509 family)
MFKAVLFDQDGVIIDTERDGHRVAFNAAFKEFGYDCQWDIGLYHKLLQVGGGKERIRYFFENFYKGKKPDDMDSFIKAIHERKTALFLELLDAMPLRPGIYRFMKEIKEAGCGIGICTTSNEKVARKVAGEKLAGIGVDLVIAGDMVTKKKPDPEIYLSAINKLGLQSGDCLVVEDSGIGVQAGAAAGCRVLATVNGYTRDEDLSPAALIVTCLGDEDGEKAEFVGKSISLAKPGILSFVDLAKVPE